jgi:oligopeptide transport system substrate-binding protein
MVDRDNRAETGSPDDGTCDELMRSAATRGMSRREILKRATALGVGASALAGLNAIGASAAPAFNRLRLMNAALQDEPLAAEQTVRLPEGEPVRFDPGVTSGGKGLEMIQNLFEGLVTIDQRDGSLQNGLAESFEPNADASEFTFTLRDGLKWSDGTPLNANDFEYSWKRVLNPETKSEYTSAMYPVKNALAIDQGSMTFDQLAVTAVDEKTLKVTLEGPTPYFPLLAATWTYYPVPKHVVEAEGDAWVEAGKMVSNGPYMLTSWEHNQSMVIDQNPNYFGEKPTITQATFTLFDDNVAQALVPFENDELDQAQVSGPDLDRVKNDETLSALMQVFPRSGTRFVFCDCTNPPTDDVRVRQALSMAINRDTLANGILKGQFTPTQTMLPPDIPGYNPEAALGENVDQAKQLLTDAGFPNGDGFPEIKLTYTSTDTIEKQTAEYLQGVWKQNLGISVSLDPLEDKAFQDWFNSVKNAPYNMGIRFWGSDWGDPANWHNQLFDSAADFYHNHWKNDQFDTTVRAAAVNPDNTSRIAAYTEAEKILVQEAPNIPLHNLNRIYVIKPNVKGIYHYPILGRTWVKYISIVEE